MKNLPYFKFYAAEWLYGDITLLDYETQGAFINICAFYWARKGDVDLNKLGRKFPSINHLINDLIKENLILTYDEGLVSIRFLDEQLGNIDRRSLTSALNGKKGGRPKKPKKPIDNLKKPNIEEKRREEKKKEIEERKAEFKNSVKSKWEELGGVNYLPQSEAKSFFEYWSEHGENDRKMRKEKQTSFDIGRRLGTWKKNYRPQNPNVRHNA